MLALPSAALAQSAGDEQYADPFGQTEQPDGSQGQPAPEPQPAPAPATPAAPAEQAVAAQQTAAPTLPGHRPAGAPAGEHAERCCSPAAPCCAGARS